MPLWLQGAVESLQLFVLSVVIVALPLIAVYLTGGFGDPGWQFIAQLSGQAWLVVHGVPLDVVVLSGANSAEATSGIFQFVPLGAILIPFFLARRSGRRLARASYADQLWQPVVSAILMYALLGLATGYLSATAEVSASWGLAALVPAATIVLGMLLGVRREAGSWNILLGTQAGEWLSTWGQNFRWTGSYLWAVVRAAFVSLMALLMFSAVVFTINLAGRWAEVVAVYQGVNAGVFGGAALTLAQAGFLPNLVVWTMAWVSGAGFSLGVGSAVTPLGTQVPPVPAIPIFGALPVGELSWGALALALPVLAGVLAGWWFLRTGEDHLDDWFALKVAPRWLSAVFAIICLAVLIGAVAGGLAGVLAWFSQGSLGFGRLSEVGPDPLNVGSWIAVEVAIGVAIGRAVAPWLEGAHRPSGVAEDYWDSSDES